VRELGDLRAELSLRIPLADGRPIKILTVTDEHTREALATPAARRIGADDTASMLERVVERRGRAPELIRCDNGPEFIAQSLRDWCRFAGVSTGYIEPRAPVQLRTWRSRIAALRLLQHVPRPLHPGHDAGRIRRGGRSRLDTD
jgi:Integrase core domain